jgi:F0F1-type ATP synthase delta subunit
MLELKYSKHLKPDELGVIIELQENLRRLDTSIELIQKYRKEGTERSGVFAKEAEQNAIGYVQRILKTLIEANRMHLLPLF